MEITTKEKWMEGGREGWVNGWTMDKHIFFYHTANKMSFPPSASTPYTKEVMVFPKYLNGLPQGVKIGGFYK